MQLSESYVSMNSAQWADYISLKRRLEVALMVRDLHAMQHKETEALHVLAQTKLTKSRYLESLARVMSSARIADHLEDQLSAAWSNFGLSKVSGDLPG